MRVGEEERGGRGEFCFMLRTQRFLRSVQKIYHRERRLARFLPQIYTDLIAKKTGLPVGYIDKPVIYSVQCLYSLILNFSLYIVRCYYAFAEILNALFFLLFAHQ